MTGPSRGEPCLAQPFVHDLTRLLVRELETLQREIALFPDDERIWRTLPGVSNSAANLALHLAGNLQHFVGAVLGRTGYLRDRPSEFGRRSGTRTEITAELDAAISVVRAVLPHVTDEQLAHDYPEPIAGATVRTGAFLLHLATHAAFHVGQVGYLRRILTGDERTAGTVSVTVLST